MPIEIILPSLATDLESATLAAWHKKEGDAIEKGEVIADVETDKATLELEAADSGTLGKILVPEGTDEVAVGEVIALLLAAGESADSLADYKAGAQTETSAPAKAAPVAAATSAAR